ncbi:hypothetical protein V6Z12_A10G246200 [Gossypium hirsutum]
MTKWKRALKLIRAINANEPKNLNLTTTIFQPISSRIIPVKSRSRAVSTERTILSPFTKEYRVLAAYCGIRLFLEAYFLFWNGPSSSSSKYYLIVFLS